MMANEEGYVDVVNHLRSQFFGLSELWATTEYAREYGITGDYSSYQNRIDLFCKVLERILTNGEARIANRGIFLQGSSKEQSDLFRRSFPKSVEEMEEKDAYWWYLEECPGELVWYTDLDDEGFQTSPVGDGRFYFWTNS